MIATKVSIRTFMAASLLALCILPLATAGSDAEETALAAVPVPAGEHPPIALHIGIHDIYCTKTACDCIGEVAGRSYDGVLVALQKSNITLDVSYFPEDADLDEAIADDKLDGVICKPWMALRHMPATGRQFKRVVDVLDPNNQATFTGQFLVNAGSPLKSLQDAAGKRIAFGQKDAYEKYHAPLRMLAAGGIQPGNASYFSSCGENLDAIMSGSADVAVISSYALTASCAVDFCKPEDFRVLASTPAIPLTSLLLDMKRVSALDASRVQKAMLAIAGESTPQDFMGKGFVAPISWKPAPLPEPVGAPHKAAQPNP